MIVKRKLPWIRLLFELKTSSLRRAGSRILFFSALSVLITAAELKFEVSQYSLTATPFTIIGLALSIFLGFRTSAAYDRYWEGRKLWGRMVNSSRSFARQVLTFVNSPASPTADDASAEELRQDLVRRMIAYVHALRHHLRDSQPDEDLGRFLSSDDVGRLHSQKNVPFAILNDIGTRLRDAWKQGQIDTFHLATMEDCLTEITDIQGGCERIKNTPIPFAYNVLTHRLVAFYCLFLPLGIIDTAGWLTPMVVLLVSHAFFGLDEIGNEIEDPFGTEPHHLPLAALCRTIEINLLQSIDDDEIPEFLQPEDSILL